MNLLQLVLYIFIPLLAAATPAHAASTSGEIIFPHKGAFIAPGASFKFRYQGRADYGVSSYNYTVWLFTSPLKSFTPSEMFETGYYFGRYSETNYPANPYPSNPPPSHLKMPDFSQNPGGFGTGASTSNAHFYLAVFEEYATGVGSVGYRISLAINRITYNGTRPRT
ncbi:hypothetical protein Hypma_000722 [Hypsizygus marmoreus]|uniref:Uncharacterized protein n=1 Tax=Hypsizygus marmoreus TaxID=39966 RepID=A0A369JGU7_HYPMA|nr:hypothetical protein Hypma_000722 [Hypsizygus marmoreus]